MKNARVVVIVLAAAACGGSDDGDGDGGSAFTPQEKARGGAVIARVGPDNGSTTMSADAYFLEYPAGGHAPDGFSEAGHPATSCRKWTSAECSVVTCALGDDPSFDIGAPGYVSAGVITLVRAGMATINMTPTPAYSASQSGVPAATDGDTLSIEAAGDVVPAFTATAAFRHVVYPVAPAAGDTEMVAAGEDLAVTWEGGTGGDVTLTAQGGGGGDPDVAILTCTFTGAAGSGVVTSDLLAHLPAGDNISVGLYNAGTAMTSGSFPIEIVAEYDDFEARMNGFTLVVTR